MPGKNGKTKAEETRGGGDHKIVTLLPENNDPSQLISPNIETTNAGVRLISNEEKIPDMLKAIYLQDEELARCIAEALAECDEFLYSPDGKPDKEVELRREWIKYLCACFCSVKGRFAQLYTDAATNIRTTAFDERGWKSIVNNYQPKQSEGNRNDYYRDNKPGQGRP